MTGAAGAPGADGAADAPYGQRGEAGGDGEAATALSDGPDDTNAATATGGAGGVGGDGGDATAPDVDGFSAGGTGGDGGAGGAALATAGTTSSSAPVSADATSLGGAGGRGGISGNIAPGSFDYGSGNGLGGAGGDAESHGSATSSSGSASATATATGGSGGSSLASTPPGGNPYPQDPYLPARNGGRGGAALADANAVSADDTATAVASARGGDAGGGGGGNSTGWANGATATAHASADGALAASATAEARSGKASPAASVQGVDAHADARAVSSLGDATAVARQFAGDGSASVIGPLVASQPGYGGSGGSASMLDAVSGSAAGRLTLLQEAIAGRGYANRPGGLAQSQLDAVNPGGGDLVAQSSATGGSGSGSSYPATTGGSGGSATASVFATDTFGSYVEGDATARGGAGGFIYYGPLPGGEAHSHATATGLGGVVALADSVTRSAYHSDAASDALHGGAIAGSHGTLDLVSSGTSPDGYSSFTRELRARAAVGVGPGASGAALPSTGVRQALVTAAPDAGDVAAWTAGNPNVQAALADWDVAALGSFAESAQQKDQSQLTGTLGLDLTASVYGGATRIALAFLDPAASGASIDLLHLAFSVDGTQVFEQSFTDSSSALAGLDDVLVDLGTLGASSEEFRQLVLSFEIDTPGGTAPDGAIALDFALLTQAVPEPAPGVSLLCAAVLLLAARASRRDSRNQPLEQSA